MSVGPNVMPNNSQLSRGLPCGLHATRAALRGLMTPLNVQESGIFGKEQSQKGHEPQTLQTYNVRSENVLLTNDEMRPKLHNKF